jgi:outer membrane biosynthesis protein TonB
MKKQLHRGGRIVQAVASVLVLLSLSATGCVRAKAKAAPNAPPPLDMPAPPPRDIETNDTEPPQPVPLPQEPARNAPPRTRPATPAQPRPSEPARPEPPKPEPAPESETRPVEEPPKPPTTLQTTPAQAEVELERNIRAALTRAASDLNRIDYRVLNADARTQYDTAKGFIRQADAAVRAKNLVYAQSLADKAATIAAQLAGK